VKQHEVAPLIDPWPQASGGAEKSWQTEWAEAARPVGGGRRQRWVSKKARDHNTRCQKERVRGPFVSKQHMDYSRTERKIKKEEGYGLPGPANLLEASTFFYS
jgi:hypothetical protein